MSGEVARRPKPPPGWSEVAVCDGRPPEDRFDIKSTSAPTRAGLRQPAKVQERARVKRGGSLLAWKHRGCLTKLTPRPFECQQRRQPSLEYPGPTSQHQHRQSAPAPAVPSRRKYRIANTEPQVVSEAVIRPTAMGNRPGPRPHDHLVALSPNKRPPDAAHTLPNHQAGRSVIEAERTMRCHARHPAQGSNRHTAVRPSHQTAVWTTDGLACELASTINRRPLG